MNKIVKRYCLRGETSLAEVARKAFAELIAASTTTPLRNIGAGGEIESSGQSFVIQILRQVHHRDIDGTGDVLIKAAHVPRLRCRECRVIDHQYAA
jgi:hypothetical protein